MSSPKRARYEKSSLSSDDEIYVEHDDKVPVMDTYIDAARRFPSCKNQYKMALMDLLDRALRFKNTSNETGIGGQCGKIFEEGELVFHCKQCATDPTCVLCATCFREVDHLDHDVTFYRSGEGTS